MGGGKHYHADTVGQGQFLAAIASGLALHDSAGSGQVLDQGTAGGLVHKGCGLGIHTCLYGNEEAVGRGLGVAFLLGVHDQDNEVLQVAGKHLGIQGVHLVQGDGGQNLLVGIHLVLDGNKGFVLKEVVQAILYEGRVLALVAVLVLEVYGREEGGTAAVQFALQETMVQDGAHLLHGRCDGRVYLSLLGYDVGLGALCHLGQEEHALVEGSHQVRSLWFLQDVLHA